MRPLSLNLDDDDEDCTQSPPAPPPPSNSAPIVFTLALNKSVTRVPSSSSSSSGSAVASKRATVVVARSGTLTKPSMTQSTLSGVRATGAVSNGAAAVSPSRKHKLAIEVSTDGSGGDDPNKKRRVALSGKAFDVQSSQAQVVGFDDEEMTALATSRSVDSPTATDDEDDSGDPGKENQGNSNGGGSSSFSSSSSSSSSSSNSRTVVRRGDAPKKKKRTKKSKSLVDDEAEEADDESAEDEDRAFQGEQAFQDAVSKDTIVNSAKEGRVIHTHAQRAVADKEMARAVKLLKSREPLLVAKRAIAAEIDSLLDQKTKIEEEEDKLDKKQIKLDREIDVIERALVKCTQVTGISYFKAVDSDEEGDDEDEEGGKIGDDDEEDVAKEIRAETTENRLKSLSATRLAADVFEALDNQFSTAAPTERKVRAKIQAALFTGYTDLELSGAPDDFKLAYRHKPTKSSCNLSYRVLPDKRVACDFVHADSSSGALVSHALELDTAEFGRRQLLFAQLKTMKSLLRPSAAAMESVEKLDAILAKNRVLADLVLCRHAADPTFLKHELSTSSTGKRNAKAATAAPDADEDDS